jgi:HK97 family phage prohead protease
MTITRSRTFGFVETKAAPEEGKAKVYRFRANDGALDRYNDRLSVKGWKLDDFNANPVIFYNHDSGLGMCSDRKTLPIGRGRAFTSGDALLVDIEFDQDDPFAKAVEQKVEKGILNAVSVGYTMVDGKFRQNEVGGYDSDEQELLEISVVTIPGNQRALRLRAAQEARDRFADEILAKAVDQVATEILKRLDARDAAKAAKAHAVNSAAGDLAALIEKSLKEKQ